MKIKYFILTSLLLILFYLIFNYYDIFRFNFLNLSSQTLNTAQASPVSLVDIPVDFPQTSNDTSTIILKTKSGYLETNIIPALQHYITKYIKNHGNPIAALILVDTEKSKILAFAQGKNPQKWGASTHTALYTNFPAASIFKIIVASAVLEVTNLDPEMPLSLIGGCGDVRPTGVWLIDQNTTYKNQMNLHKAFGLSCNSFFAKLAINYIGFNGIKNYAYGFGWEKPIPADFKTFSSPLHAPSVENSSIHSIGRFAAGFGRVGLSPIHAAWIMNAIANNGKATPLRLFKTESLKQENLFNIKQNELSQQILSSHTSKQLIDIMDYTVSRGTAHLTFRKYKYKFLRNILGGKTGTLKSTNPVGIATWFVGLMPLNNPKIAVISLVILDKVWHIKATDLAAEALWKYEQIQKQKNIVLQDKDKTL